MYNQRKRKYIQEKKHFQHLLLQSQIETQEETMSVLGKELHDNIGQLLSSTKMLIGITERSLPNPPETLLTANETLSKAIQELRSLSKSLDKAWLEQFSFTENLSAEVNRINSAREVTIQFSSATTLLLDADKQLILFRVVQEAIQNALKHAKAKNIFIQIATNENATEQTIIIKDDGVGFNTANISNGIGISNIKQRTKLLGGVVNWQSNEGGTEISIHLPINKSTS